MRYYARAFPPTGGTPRGPCGLVHLVRARARLVFRAAASPLRSDDGRGRGARRPADHARAHLRGRAGRVEALRERRRVLAVLRLVRRAVRRPLELLDRGRRTPGFPHPVPPVPLDIAEAAQAISKKTAG